MLQSHKRVSKRLYQRFNDWHTKWLQENCEEVKGCDEWLMGKCYEGESNRDAPDPNGDEDESDQRDFSCRTKTKRIKIEEKPDKSPYRAYCKYKVEATPS